MPSPIEHIVLVDENDSPIGTEEKLTAHKMGLLHRAFSIFIFNQQGELLLQKRASSKYHSGGLWTNTCCSHPRPEEDLMEACHRRLEEEMGFDCALQEAFHFIYKAEVGNGLVEHELDHVLVGTYNEDPLPNPEEAEEFAWISLDSLQNDVRTNPENYTEWLKLCLPKIRAYTKATCE